MMSRLGLVAPLLIVLFAGACGASSGSVHGPAVDFDAAATANDADVAADAGDASAPGDASTDAPIDGSAPMHADPAVWLKQVVYLTIPDRFFNGDKTNDGAGQAS